MGEANSNTTTILKHIIHKHESLLISNARLHNTPCATTHAHKRWWCRGRRKESNATPPTQIHETHKNHHAPRPTQAGPRKAATRGNQTPTPPHPQHNRSGDRDGERRHRPVAKHGDELDEAAQPRCHTNWPPALRREKQNTKCNTNNTPRTLLQTPPGNTAEGQRSRRATDLHAVQRSVDAGRDGLDLRRQLLLHAVQVVAVIEGDEVDGQTQVPKATRSSNTMQVRL